ncbi:MAG TPA: acyl-CoA dehydrogenase family protein [Acidimicrobiales bacterium]|nr:acyl-CoA dehydrogenase family protein [Acidimicrobiales bacterium]
MTAKVPRDGFVADVERIARDVAAPVADDVDREARFPSEALEALRKERALSALIPPDLGGSGAGIGQVASATSVLAQHCASTAMVFAMHNMQAACLARHGRSEFLHDVARQVADQQLLLASATTEAGVGGDLRTSRCALQRADGRFRLEKQAPVISYGAFADMVLATARRSPDSPPSDQVLVVCGPPGMVLEPAGDWDTLGFRGTVSPGFVLKAEGDERYVVDDPFSDILQQTMLPVSHILWSSVWLGLAAAAVDRARQVVRAEARKQPGTTPPGALRLAELMVVFQQMQSLLSSATRRYEDVLDDPVALSGMGFAIEMNSLKIGASTLVVDIVNRAMVVCGMAGYRQDSPYSLGRLVRDAHGAAVMVNNDRILANNAQMLLVHKES